MLSPIHISQQHWHWNALVYASSDSDVQLSIHPFLDPTERKCLLLLSLLTRGGSVPMYGE